MPHTQTTNCWNLKVCVELNQGGRRYMEDMTSVKFERSTLGNNTIEYAAFAVYDGHGGKQAAFYARDHLLDNLKKQKGFYVNDAESVKQAMIDAFNETHIAMWKVLPEWPKTANGHPSTAGTTASVCVIRGNKLYVANVGDSMVVMGVKEQTDEWDKYKALKLTIDHKPELEKEKARIEASGGCIVKKQGVNRVVWQRPQHPGTIRRSTSYDKIPFLAVSRSLGDLWSYNNKTNNFIVSPIPDVYDYDLHQNKNQFLIIASDGLWNMVSPDEAISIVAKCEKEKQENKNVWSEGPANSLVKAAMKMWRKKNLRADNTSVITVIIDRAKFGKKLRTDAYCDAWVSGNSTKKSENASDGKVDVNTEDSKQPIERLGSFPTSTNTSTPPSNDVVTSSIDDKEDAMTSSSKPDSPQKKEGDDEKEQTTATTSPTKRIHEDDNKGGDEPCGKKHKTSSEEGDDETTDDVELQKSKTTTRESNSS